MLSLILVVLVVGRIVYCILRKRWIFASKVFVLVLLASGMFIGGMIAFAFGRAEASKKIPIYQCVNQLIEIRMEVLKKDFINGILKDPEQSKENFEIMLDEFVKEYNELREEFEINNNIINQYSKYDNSNFKFLLYFGH